MALTVEEVEAVLRLKDQLSGPLNTAGKNVSGFGDTLQKMAGVAATAFAFKEVASAAGKMLTFAGHLDDVARKSGLSTTAVQELDYVAKQSGSSFDQVSQALAIMGRTLSDPAKGVPAMFGKMGLSIDDLRAKKPDEAFQMIADKISLIENPMLRSKVAMEIFGKSGAELLPVLTSNIESLRLKAHDTGNVLRDDLVAAGDELGDKWTTLQGQMQVMQAQALIPLVETFMKLPAPMQTALTLGSQLAPTIGAMGLAWATLGKSIVGSLGSLATFATNAGTAGTATATFGGSLRGLLGVLGPIAIAIGAVWAAWEIGNIDAVKNKVAEWTLQLSGMNAEQARAAVLATAAGEAAAKQAAAADLVMKSAAGTAAAATAAAAAINEHALALAINTQATEAAAEAAKKHKELLKEAADFESSLLGVQIVRTQDLAHTVEVSNAAAAAQEALNKKVAEFESELRTAAPTLNDFFAATVAQWNDNYKFLQDAAAAHWRTISQINNELGLKQMQKDVAAMRGVLGNVFAGLGETFKTQFGSTIMSALTGGGDIIKSVGGLMGGSITKSIFGGEAIQKTITSTFGATLGGAFNSLLPGIGALAGPLISGIASLFGKSAGRLAGEKADAEIASMKSALLDTYGSLQKIVEVGGAAGAELEGLWGSRNIGGLKEFKAAVKDFNTTLAEQETITRRNQAATEEAARVSRGTFVDITDSINVMQAQLANDEAIKRFQAELETARTGGVYSFGSMLSAFETLKASLGETPEIIALRQGLEQAAKTGTFEFDKFGALFKILMSSLNMDAHVLNTTLSKPIIKMIEVHTVDMAKANEREWAERASDESKQDAIRAWLAQNPGDRARIPSGLGLSLDEVTRLGFKTGTLGRFVDFGSGTDVTLHGRERIVTESEGRSDRATMGALLGILQSIDHRLRVLPTAVASAAATAQR